MIPKKGHVSDILVLSKWFAFHHYLHIKSLKRISNIYVRNTYRHHKGRLPMILMSHSRSSTGDDYPCLRPMAAWGAICAPGSGTRGCGRHLRPMRHGRHNSMSLRLHGLSKPGGNKFTPKECGCAGHRPDGYPNARRSGRAMIFIPHPWSYMLCQAAAGRCS